MKRLFSLLLAGALFLNIAILNPVYAGVEGKEQTEQAEEAADTPEEEVVEEVAGDEATEEVVEEVSTEVKAMESEEEGAAFAKGIEQLKIKFIEGGPEFMGIVLVCLIFGLALVIERIIYLNMATTNTKQLVEEIDSAFPWVISCRE